MKKQALKGSERVHKNKFCLLQISDPGQRYRPSTRRWWWRVSPLSVVRRRFPPDGSVESFVFTEIFLCVKAGLQFSLIVIQGTAGSCPVHQHLQLPRQGVESPDQLLDLGLLGRHIHWICSIILYQTAPACRVLRTNYKCFRHCDMN